MRSGQVGPTHCRQSASVTLPLLINFAWPFNAAIGVSTSPLLLIVWSTSSRAGSIVLNGETSPGVCDHQLTTPCLGSARGGNEVWQRTSMKHSAQGLCARDCTPRAGAPPFPKWPDGRRTIQLHPIVQCDSVRTPGVLLLLRRLWCPLPLSASSCRCGRPLDPSGHHRAACPHAGVLGRRGFQLESAAARVCREAGGRVTTNVRVQDLDLPPRAGADNRRSEVVADGLPLFHGVQLAIDTTMVSPVRMDGSARRHCATTDGAAMAQVRVRKVRTHPELAQAHNSLANAKVRDEPEDFKKVVKASWFRKWKALFASAAARAFALSLLERRCAPGCDAHRLRWSGPTTTRRSGQVVRTLLQLTGFFLSFEKKKEVGQSTSPLFSQARCKL